MTDLGINYMNQCPICEFYTLKNKGAFEICPVCYWEDDGSSASDNPPWSTVANAVDGETAKENFNKFGAIEKRALALVRPPLQSEIGDKDESIIDVIAKRQKAAREC